MAMTIRELKETNVPHQVLFWDGEGYCAGIQYQNLIICGCCGGVFDIDEVVDSANDSGVYAIKAYDTWVDLSDEIKGDDYNFAVPVEEDE